MPEVLLRPSLPKPSNLFKNSIFTYFQEETEKKDGASCVFLLWGSENSESSRTWAVDVPITDIENEYEIFDSLKKKYVEELGLLRRCLSFRRFSRIKPVTVCSHRLTACLPVLKLNIVPVDLPFLKKILSLRGTSRPEQPSQELLRSTGRSGENYRVDSRLRFDRFSRLLLSRQLWGIQPLQQRLPNQLFKTLWCPKKCLYVFLGILLSVVTGGKFFWGSWEVIFGAGSFIVALSMLVLTVLSYYNA